MARKQSIIIEGPDASGKSTLANKLGVYYGLYVFRAGPKPIGYQHSLICMTYQNSWITRSSCIWDRYTCISNTCNLPEPSYKSMKNYKMAINASRRYAVIIVCTAQNLKNHKLENNETQKDFDKIQKENATVTKNYIQFAHDTPNIITYDFNIKPFDSLVEELDHALSIHI